MSHTNNPDLFPNLRAVKLESFAHTWAEYFTFIKHMSLYQKPVDGFDFVVKYIIFFELSEIRETDGFSERDESFIELLEGPDALTWLNTKSGDFKEIYRDTPHDNFFDEWRFVTNLPEGIHEEHSWVLYSRTEKDSKNYADFIKNLKIYYENDNEIKIQEAGKAPKCFTCQSLGFRDNQTKEWKTLIRILQDIPPIYSIKGPAYKHVNGKKERLPFYDAQQKLLGEINNKFINFFNKNYSLEIPNNFKLYELCQGEKSGTYKFKFRVISDGTDAVLESNKDKIIDELEELCEKYNKTNNDTTMEKIAIKAKIVLKQGWLTEGDIKEMLEPDKNKEEIIYDPHENIEDSEPEY